MFGNSKWINSSMPNSNSEEVSKYLNLETPLSDSESSQHNSISKEKFDFDLFSNLWGNFEFEEWILSNKNTSWSKDLWITQYLSKEAVADQMDAKLFRLGKVKDEAQHIVDEMRKDRLKEINKLEMKAAKQVLTNATTFLPYDDIDKVQSRKRSRWLTFAENEELKEYQKRSGIPITESSSTSQPSYPASIPEPLGRPIGKPTGVPVIPLPGQAPPSYPAINPGYNRPPGNTSVVPPPPMPAGYMNPPPPVPNRQAPPPAPPANIKRKKGMFGLRKLFGLNA